MSELGRLVQEYRDHQKYPVSDAQIAKAIGVTRSTVGNWIRGTALPTPVNLRQLAHHIDTPYLRVFEAAMTDAGYLPKDTHDGDTAPTTTLRTARRQSRSWSRPPTAASPQRPDAPDAGDQDG